MNLEKRKEMMKEWEDYYGQDICAVDKINNAKTKSELLDVINSHIRFIEMQNIDAVTHAEIFKKSLKLE